MLPNLTRILPNLTQSNHTKFHHATSSIPSLPTYSLRWQYCNYPSSTSNATTISNIIRPNNSENENHEMQIASCLLKLMRWNLKFQLRLRKPSPPPRLRGSNEGHAPQSVIQINHRPLRNRDQMNAGKFFKRVNIWIGDKY